MKESALRRLFYPLCMTALGAALLAVLYRLAQQWVSPGSIPGLLPGADVYFFPEKTRETAWYLAAVPSLFAVFCGLLAASKRFPKPDGLSDAQLKGALVCISIFTAGVLFASPKCPLFQAAAYAAAFILLGGYAYARNKTVRKTMDAFIRYWKTSPGLQKSAYRIWTGAKAVLLAASLTALVWMIQPFLSAPPRLLAEFAEVPTQTVLLGEPVNTQEFVRQHPVLGQWQTDPDPIAVREFIRLNEWDILAGVMDRFVIHHHAHLFNPAFELQAGRPVHEIFFQYGFGNAWLIKELMNAAGGISWQNYFKILFSFYYIYYALFLAAIWLVFKKFNYVLLGALGVLGSLGTFGFLSVWIAPGANPLRHFFDLFVFTALFYYWKTAKIRWLWLCTALICLACLNCFSTGAALLIAAGAALTVRMLELPDANRFKREFWPVFAAVAAATSVLFTIRTAGTDTTVYFLKGLLGFLLTPSGLFWLGVCLVGGYLVYWVFGRKQTPYAPLFLFAFFYAQGMLLYYVWGSDTRHLMVVFPLCLLAGLCGWRLAEETLRKHTRQILFLLLFTAVTLFAWNGLKNYRRDRQAVQHSFDQHVLYQWTLPNARFLSAMDPAYFEESAALLAEYAPDEKGIYMISQYDLFLPFLAGKYNAMPFISLTWFLVSQPDMDSVTAFLQEKQPRYLFVDTNLDKMLPYADIPANSAYFKTLAHDAKARESRRENLSRVFAAVQKNYNPIKKGKLITVYERIN